jgi:hypothetical protein
VARNTTTVAIGQRDRLRPALQAEDDGVEGDPHHEVFPVDVDPTPVVGEPGRQQVVVVGLGEPEAEQVEHPQAMWNWPETRR